MQNQGYMIETGKFSVDNSMSTSALRESDALEVLVKYAVKGDRDALQLLCEKVADDVLFRATFVSGNHSDAEDIAQEALMRVCGNIQKLRDPKAFRGWLARIIINEARRYIRNNSRHGVVVSIDDYSESLTEDRNDALPYENAEKKERNESVKEIISVLPTKQREAVLLHYYDGLNVTEVAVVMGTSKANISQNLTLALKRLKNELEKKQRSTLAYAG